MSRREGVLAAVLLTLLVAAPLTASNVVLNFLMSALIVALAAQGWNLLAGFGGQFSFGHAAFFGTGAYAAAILQMRYGINAWAACLCGLLAGGLVGWIIGGLAFRARLRGSYFALITLAFAEVLRICANAAQMTGGAAGLLVKLDVRAANFQFSSRATFVWIALGCVAAVLAGTAALARSRFGAYLVAVRENEDAARALGVDTLAVKLRAITLSGAITAAAGCLYTQYFLYIDADIAFGTRISVEVLLAAIVGGIGTVLGPVVGALALHGLGELTRLSVGSVTGIDLVLFGLILVAVIAFAPGGIVGSVRRLRGGRA